VLVLVLMLYVMGYTGCNLICLLPSLSMHTYFEGHCIYIPMSGLKPRHGDFNHVGGTLILEGKELKI